MNEEIRVTTSLKIKPSVRDKFKVYCIEKKIDIVWSCYGKVNYVKPERMKKMAKAGCWNVFFGLESGNQELLNFMKNLP